MNTLNNSEHISTEVQPFLGYSLYKGRLEELDLTRKLVINTINQYSYCVAKKKPAFKRALRKSDILLPDGVGVTWASQFLGGSDLTKIAGADLHQFLLTKLNARGGRCFYMGSSPATLAKIKQRLAIEYPNVEVEVYSPPFKPNFTKEDDAQIIEAVNAFKPDVLFVGLTAPKQELWVTKHKAVLDARQICSIGAVFDFYAGTIKRPNQLWIDLGLEWLGRLLAEPKRMANRYLYHGPRFVAMILGAKFRMGTGRASTVRTASR